MKQENIDYLKLHIHHWHTLRDAAYITNVSGETAKQLLRIAREEWDPFYQTVLHHIENVYILIQYVYMQFEKASAKIDACRAGHDNCEQAGDTRTQEPCIGEAQAIDNIRMDAAPACEAMRSMTRLALKLQITRLIAGLTPV